MDRITSLIRHRSVLLLLATTSLGLWGSSASAQSNGAIAAGGSGRVVGRIIDADNGAPLQGAQVLVPGADASGLSSLDGRYVLRDVPPGTVDLQVNLIGYGSKTVTGVEVTDDQTTALDIQLQPAAVELEGITVSASAERGSTTSLMIDRQRASVLSDAIGREQMDRSPDGDAGAALQRVPGMTVVDGKFAYVRGLGERYSQTTLNGSPLASPVPDRKVIPLDVFPSSLLESIVTSKSYSPEDPGDYAGGLVKLKTRSFPPNRILSVSIGTGWSSVGTLGTGLGYDPGNNLDVLGFDDGARALPSAIPNHLRVNSSNFSPGDLQTFGRSLGGDWGPTPQDIPLNTSFGLTYGDDFDFDEDERLGFIASANYSNSFDVREHQLERAFTGSNVEDPKVDYLGDLTTQTVRWGGLLNLTYQPTASHEIAFSGIYSRLVDDLARRFEGFNSDSNTNQLNTRLQYIATAMVNAQLEGRHNLGVASAHLDWRGAITKATRYEPNTRDMLYRQSGEQFVFDDFVQSGSVFHQDQSDDGWSGGATLTLPFEMDGRAGNLALGGSTDRKERDAYTRRFRFRPYRGGDTELTDEILTLAPNELVEADHIGPRALLFQESTFSEDNYTAAQDVDAAFVKLDVEPLDGVRISGGVRVEKSRQSATPRDLFGPTVSAPTADLDETDLLPALNLTLELNDAMNLRGSASRTLARPQLRELAPFSFADYAGGYLVSGNPTLNRSRIQNYDLRWEWFPGLGSVFAVSAFYKMFDDPIEVLVLPSTELIRSWVNAPEATNYGAEFEVRGGLGFLASALERVQFNGNLTVVESEVQAGGVSTVYIPNQGPLEITTIDRPRALQGQSPYVVNVGLTWSSGLDGGSTASLLFNRFGERIDIVGREASPDIYEAARNQLDLVLERPVGDFKMKLSASRLLGNKVRFTQGGAITREYELGRTVSLSLAWDVMR